MDNLPPEISKLLNTPCFEEVGDSPVNAGAIRFFASTVQDGDPAYWADKSGDVLSPPAMLSTWVRPLMWRPGPAQAPQSLRLHFLVKEKLDLPRAVVVETETELVAPVRPGMRIKSQQILAGVDAPTSNRLGEGRYWHIRVEYHCADNGQLLGAEDIRFFGYRPEKK